MPICIRHLLGDWNGYNEVIEFLFVDDNGKFYTSEQEPEQADTDAVVAKLQ